MLPAAECFGIDAISVLVPKFRLLRPTIRLALTPNLYYVFWMKSSFRRLLPQVPEMDILPGVLFDKLSWKPGPSQAGSLGSIPPHTVSSIFRAWHCQAAWHLVDLVP